MACQVITEDASPRATVSITTFIPRESLFEGSFRSCLKLKRHDYGPVVLLVSSQYKAATMQETQYLLMMHEQRIEFFWWQQQVPHQSHYNNYTQQLEAYNHQNSPYFASAGSINDPIYYMDSGATNHFTSNLGNLSLRYEYNGNERLTVGNVAERKHSHLVESGLTLLAYAHMSLKFWSEFFQTAALLINNLLTPLLNLSTYLTKLQLLEILWLCLLPLLETILFSQIRLSYIQMCVYRL
ncbi:hypothetical protein ACOSQ4_004495 [Xanthoceras sorbifolium]